MISFCFGKTDGWFFDLIFVIFDNHAYLLSGRFCLFISCLQRIIIALGGHIVLCVLIANELILRKQKNFKGG